MGNVVIVVDTCQILLDEEAGFRIGRLCTEQIFALRNIIEHSLEQQKDLITNFIDFRKAFGSIVSTGHPCGRYWSAMASLSGT